MSYQSVLRNSSNVLLAETLVGIKISVLQGGASDTPVYVETQTATTNANGLLSIQIGAGTATTGSFATINWAAGSYFIKTETDPAGGTNYSITGTQEILSVPYAMYAAKSGDATTMGAIGSSSSTNGATINAGVLSLTPADATTGGIVNNGTQTIGGAKTFTQSVTANSFVKTGGLASEYLMADGSTSMGLVNEGSFSMSFSGQLVNIKYKEIIEGSSKIVHLYIPKFRIYGTRYSSLSSNLSNLLPENIRPYNDQALPCNIAVSNADNQDNNGGFTILHYIFNYVGLFEIQPSGAISFILPSGGPWNYIDGTAFNQTITYVVN
jgi:hypothetical protein